MTIRMSTRDAAERSLCTHSFRPGRGYIDHGAAPPIDGRPKKLLADILPKTGKPQDGSRHLLLPPNATKGRMFQWVEAEEAWRQIGQMGGHRMAFKASYLAHHGWTYLGALN